MALSKYQQDNGFGGRRSASDLYSIDQSARKQASGAGLDTIKPYHTEGNASGNGGTSTASAVPTAEQSPDSVYLDEIQKAVSERNYKALFNADIAAYNLKRNAQKYLGNSFASQGLATQGYGTSAHVGIENNAANLYAQNLESYNEAQRTAQQEALTRQESRDTANAEQLLTYIQNGDGSDESINGYMEAYGYRKGEDGKWVDGNGSPASPAIVSAIQYAKESAGSSSSVSSQSALEFAQQYARRGEGFNASYDDLVNLTKGNGEWAMLGNSMKYLKKAVEEDGSNANGTLYVVKGEHNAVGRFLYVNGKYYFIHENEAGNFQGKTVNVN